MNHISAILPATSLHVKRTPTPLFLTMRFIAFKLFSELINPSPIWAITLGKSHDSGPRRGRVHNRGPQTPNRGSSSMSPVTTENSPIGYDTLAAATAAARRLCSTYIDSPKY